MLATVEVSLVVLRSGIFLLGQSGNSARNDKEIETREAVLDSRTRRRTRVIGSEASQRVGCDFYQKTKRAPPEIMRASSLLCIYDPQI